MRKTRLRQILALLSVGTLAALFTGCQPPPSDQRPRDEQPAVGSGPQVEDYQTGRADPDSPERPGNEPSEPYGSGPDEADRSRDVLQQPHTTGTPQEGMQRGGRMQIEPQPGTPERHEPGVGTGQDDVSSDSLQHQDGVEPDRRQYQEESAP